MPGISTEIDLRSDTVTRPMPSMRRAMARAEIGDDQYGEDPTVHRLEERFARLVGKEAALFVATGTMGNLVAMLSHCQRGDEAILGNESHFFWYGSGVAAALGGIAFNLLPTARTGEFNLTDLAQAMRQSRPGYPRTGVLCLENSHNRCGGGVLTPGMLRQMARIAREHDVPVHLDGARLFNAAAALGLPASEIAAEVDTIQCCLSKGLAAPVGTLVAGSASFIARARTNRKLVGGAMRQAGVLAAAGLVALDEMIARLPEDHRRARYLAERLATMPGVGIDLDSVQTNIVIFRPPSHLTSSEVIATLAKRGIRISDYGTRGLRVVTHYEIDDATIATALHALTAVMAPVPVAT